MLQTGGMDAESIDGVLRTLCRRYPAMAYVPNVRSIWHNSFASSDRAAVEAAVATWIEAHPDFPTPAELHELIRRQSLGIANARAALAKGYVEEARRLGRDPAPGWVERQDSPEVTHPAK